MIKFSNKNKNFSFNMEKFINKKIINIQKRYKEKNILIFDFIFLIWAYSRFSFANNDEV